MKNARFLLHLLLITALSAALYPFPLLLAICLLYTSPSPRD